MDSELEIWHLAVGGSSMLLLALIMWFERLSLWKSALVASLRMVVQLSLLGIVLDFLFSSGAAWGTVGFLFVMLIAASRESVQRIGYRLPGLAHYLIPLWSLLLAALPYSVLLISVIFKPNPWYEPAIVLPIFGMILGNVMNTISLALNHSLNAVQNTLSIIEQRIALGDEFKEIMREIRAEAVRVAMLPVINAMAVTGIVSLPGMMTGQILAGESPGQAVRYQILIWFGIAFGAGLSCIITLYLAEKSLVNNRGLPTQLLKKI